MPPQESAGFFSNDIAYLRVGHGPPLVMVLGLTRDHEMPRGWQRRAALLSARAFARDFTVYLVNRKRGLKSGETMADIAAHLAAAIADDIGGPVFLQGTSTGGSVALQLATDYPDLVRRLVLVSAACRLAPSGRALQGEMARLIRAGAPRRAWASLETDLLPGTLRGAAQALSWLAAGVSAPFDPADLLVTLDAEDAFDVEADLGRVTAPTLVIGGGDDTSYTVKLFEDTAAGVRDGRAHIFPGWGHARTSVSAATSHLTLGFMLAGDLRTDRR